MVTIKNQDITVKIAKRGAEIKSIVKDGKEYMWSADPKFWAGTAPIMFPICGGFKNGRYELDGKSYEMPKHGFARHSDFEVESADDTSVTMLLCDNEETRKIYPYSFEFRAKFVLDGSKLHISYEAKNLDTKEMYCTFGAHEAYACREGVDAYDVIFSEEETLYAYGLNGDILTDYTKKIIENSKVLSLKDSYFCLDALVFRDLKSKSAELVHRDSGKTVVKLDFEGFPYFLLWHKFTAPYLCMEPWCGIPDVAGSSYDLKEKEGMTCLAPGECFSATHTITVGDKD